MSFDRLLVGPLNRLTELSRARANDARMISGANGSAHSGDQPPLPLEFARNMQQPTVDSHSDGTSDQCRARK